jgi:hypothetical protein
LYLLFGTVINSRGEIAGFGATSSGDIHGFLATPNSGKFGRASAESVASGVTSPVDLSEDARKLVRQRLPFGRLGVSPMGSR